MMLKLIQNLLQQIINDIDAGNSNVSEDEQEELLNLIQKITDQDLSKIEASRYINVSRSTFDNYISKGLLPQGRKRAGFKELSWKKTDLDKFLKSHV